MRDFSLKPWEVANSWLIKASALFIVAGADSNCCLCSAEWRHGAAAVRVGHLSAAQLRLCCASEAAGEPHWMRHGTFFFLFVWRRRRQRTGGYLPVWRTVSGSKDGKRRQSADLQRRETHAALDLASLRTARRELERVRVCTCVHILVLVQRVALVAFVDDWQLVQQGRRLLGKLLKNLQGIEQSGRRCLWTRWPVAMATRSKAAIYPLLVELHKL